MTKEQLQPCTKTTGTNSSTEGYGPLLSPTHVTVNQYFGLQVVDGIEAGSSGRVTALPWLRCTHTLGTDGQGMGKRNGEIN